MSARAGLSSIPRCPSTPSLPTSISIWSVAAQQPISRAVGPASCASLAPRRSPELWPLIEQVNADDGARFALDSADAEGGFCRSDQWNYSRYGIPVAFLTTGSHIDFHAVTDEAQYIDYAKLSAVTGFTVALARRLAERPLRLRTDGARPDPSRYCSGR